MRLTKKERKALAEERKALVSFINHGDRWVQTSQIPDSPDTFTITYKYTSNYKMVDEEMKE